MSSSISYIKRNKEIGEKKKIAVSDKTLSKSIGVKTKPLLPKNTKPLDASKIKSPVGKDNFYATDKAITNKSLNTIINDMNKSVYLSNSSDTVENSFVKASKYYNRFKMANQNLPLQKGFAHVFFVRPDCNLLQVAGKGYELRDGLKSNELFSYGWQSSPSVLKELVTNNGSKHDFMLSLSNYAASFPLSDEYINSDTYGRTYTGYKIAYGKNNIESKTAGEITVSYSDDRNFHIYQLHRYWVEYINAVYRGEIAPKNSNIINKILDYVSACYYFLTAEDGETIIFWSKYYGVFPTTIPSNQYSWGSGSVVSNPTIDISYKYSFKEDFNPYTMLEFNYNARIESNSATYLPVYDAKAGHSGSTWVGVPFVELVKDEKLDCPYVYKLRFTP